MIIVKLTDGLGNQIFQYAFAKKLSKTLSREVFLDVSDINNTRHYDDYYQNKWFMLCAKREPLITKFKLSLPVLEEGKAKKIDRQYQSDFMRYCKDFNLLRTKYFKEGDNPLGIKKISSCKNYYIEGYFCKLEYYKDIKAELIADLTPDNRFDCDCLREMTEDAETVSVHIRRGDFLNVGRDISCSNYYQKAIEYIKSNIANPFFLYFTDDPDWLERELSIRESSYVVSGGDYDDVEEFTIMSKCRHHIVGNSTYSYWAAYLNDYGIVTVPNGWRTLVIPSNWKRIQR